MQIVVEITCSEHPGSAKKAKALNANSLWAQRGGGVPSFPVYISKVNLPFSLYGENRESLGRRWLL